MMARGEPGRRLEMSYRKSVCAVGGGVLTFGWLV